MFNHFRRVTVSLGRPALHQEHFRTCSLHSDRFDRGIVLGLCSWRGLCYCEWFLVANTRWPHMYGGDEGFELPTYFGIFCICLAPGCVCTSRGLRAGRKAVILWHTEMSIIHESNCNAYFLEIIYDNICMLMRVCIYGLHTDMSSSLSTLDWYHGWFTQTGMSPESVDRPLMPVPVHSVEPVHFLCLPVMDACGCVGLCCAAWIVYLQGRRVSLLFVSLRFNTPWHLAVYWLFDGHPCTSLRCQIVCAIVYMFKYRIICTLITLYIYIYAYFNEYTCILTRTSTLSMYMFVVFFNRAYEYKYIYIYMHLFIHLCIYIYI